MEWGEKFPSVVKRSDGEILIEHAGGDTRNITLTLKEKETGASSMTSVRLAGSSPRPYDCEVTDLLFLTQHKPCIKATALSFGILGRRINWTCTVCSTRNLLDKTKKAGVGKANSGNICHKYRY